MDGKTTENSNNSNQAADRNRVHLAEVDRNESTKSRPSTHRAATKNVVDIETAAHHDVRNGPGNTPTLPVANGTGNGNTPQPPPMIPSGVLTIYHACSKIYPDQPNPLQVSTLKKYW